MELIPQHKLDVGKTYLIYNSPHNSMFIAKIILKEEYTFNKIRLELKNIIKPGIKDLGRKVGSPTGIIPILPSDKFYINWTIDDIIIELL